MTNGSLIGVHFQPVNGGRVNLYQKLHLDGTPTLSEEWHGCMLLYCILMFDLCSVSPLVLPSNLIITQLPLVYLHLTNSIQEPILVSIQSKVGMDLKMNKGEKGSQMACLRFKDIAWSIYH